MENELWRRWSDEKVVVNSPTLQLILEPFFRFTYVTDSSLTSPGEPPLFSRRNLHWDRVYFGCQKEYVAVEDSGCWVEGVSSSRKWQFPPPLVIKTWYRHFVSHGESSNWSTNECELMDSESICSFAFKPVADSQTPMIGRVKWISIRVTFVAHLQCLTIQWLTLLLHVRYARDEFVCRRRKQINQIQLMTKIASRFIATNNDNAFDAPITYFKHKKCSQFGWHWTRVSKFPEFTIQIILLDLLFEWMNKYLRF